MGDIFIAGGTGYMGRRLIPALAAREHRIRAVVRPGSENKLPGECPIDAVPGDVLNGASYAARVTGCHTFVHLVGTPHPAPWKERQFREVDLASLRESVHVAAGEGVRNFVFVSVAHPAPTMRAYIAVRRECEAAIAQSGLAANILRPWYVLGPGHRWPYLLVPFYKLAERLPWTRSGAVRLGLVSLNQMIAALVWAVEHPPAAAGSINIVDVPAIRLGAWPIHPPPATSLSIPRAAPQVPPSDKH
jgi:nucleoside-diphosphate-sugar epimerase